MYPTITAIAAYAAQQLEECRLWTVHSVYKKTVNLQAGERLLALQAASSPMSPISIITDMDVRAFEVLPVKPGQQVSIAGSRIIISSPGTHSRFLVPAEKSLLHPVNLPARAVSLQRASFTDPSGRRQLAGRHIPASVLRFHGRTGDYRQRGIQPNSGRSQKPNPPMQRMSGTAFVRRCCQTPGRTHWTGNRPYAQR